MATSRPFFVIIPGGSQNPTHYGYLAHLLQKEGYPTYSALLPSVGSAAQTTTRDDMAYIRDRMILPILDYEERDVITIMHSYGGIPGSAAALGLSKKERLAQGKKTGVIGQIYYAALINQGSEGDGPDIFTITGGAFPPYLRPDKEANLVFCDERIAPLYPDVPPVIAEAAAASTMVQGLTSFFSPIPRASWDSDDYKGRVAYIRTVNDTGFPLSLQQMLIDSTGDVEWIVKDIESAHSPQLSHPEKLTEMLLDLAKGFEEKA
ncbi:hypothetical protein K505DRAFT_352239 [Melanomma pulvis-pyrius CBS 109.77]|uniref:AB hydrolase-1 domain-containing protein n=1 Tax=Melanomma pulvis-pyrius CBS 109.77 TaxID=1314802 RepID=A0A6A6X0U7_9PLEO|nr:hypothetical protein K505DRAFT_352239 [Melanomma pulvis-pyrius CBS 109.77]